MLKIYFQIRNDLTMNISYLFDFIIARSSRELYIYGCNNINILDLSIKIIYNNIITNIIIKIIINLNENS